MAQSGNLILDLLQSSEQLACPHNKHITPIEPWAGSSDAYHHYRCEVCGYRWGTKKTDLSPAVTDKNTILLEDGTEADIVTCGYIGEQLWILATANGVDWALPTAWPNNAAPLCRESEPEQYAAIAKALDR
jgi:hypothetical protein